MLQVRNSVYGDWGKQLRCPAGACPGRSWASLTVAACDELLRRYRIVLIVLSASGSGGPLFSLPLSSSIPHPDSKSLLYIAIGYTLLKSEGGNCVSQENIGYQTAVEGKAKKG